MQSWIVRTALWIIASACLVLALLVVDDRGLRLIFVAGYIVFAGATVWLGRPRGTSGNTR